MPAPPRRKAFGQHFLRDTRVIEGITNETLKLVNDFSAKGLLEIGPGKGAITQPLLVGSQSIQNLERFLIVEMDKKFAEHWREVTSDLAIVEVISQDFLKLPAEKFLEKKPLIVVSNLPYSSGTAILTELAQYPHDIPAMVLMFQAEVAARLRAEPDTKAWGSLSIWIQNRWDVMKLLSVPPNAFVPPPDVNSEVIVLRTRRDARVPASVGNDLLWTKLLRLAFAHRRKMLRSGLPKNSIWQTALEPAGIAPTERAEDLTWEDWSRWMAEILKLTKAQTST